MKNILLGSLVVISLMIFTGCNNSSAKGETTAKCGADKKAQKVKKCAEGKCGEGKCGGEK